MWHSSRVISILLSIVGINAGLVVWSVVDRHSLAQTPNESSGASRQDEDQRLLDSIPKPDLDQLTIPIAPADIESDIGFQKFREEAAELIPSLSNTLNQSLPIGTDGPQPTLSNSAATQFPAGDEYLTRDEFATMERRLQVVSHLTEAALGLTREAEELSSLGATERATELMQKTKLLRQLSAELLVDAL